MSNETIFFAFGIALAVSAVLTSLVGLKLKDFPGKAFPLVVLWFAILVGGATTFAVLHAKDEDKAKAAKFEQATPLIARRLPTTRPEAAFYLWARTPIDEVEYARRLHEHCNVTVLPGSFLARTTDGLNPGRGYVRIALVALCSPCKSPVSGTANSVEMCAEKPRPATPIANVFCASTPQASTHL